MKDSKNVNVSFDNNVINAISEFGIHAGIKKRNGEVNLNAAVRRLVEFMVIDLGENKDIREIMEDEGSNNILYYAERAVRSVTNSRKRKKEEEVNAEK